MFMTPARPAAVEDLPEGVIDIPFMGDDPFIDIPDIGDDDADAAADPVLGITATADGSRTTASTALRAPSG
jgi:hypothetical protein